MTVSKPHTVLIVEDEEDLREMMREALEMKGYRVVTAEEGQEALAKIDSIDQLCLVLLDLLMPGMNGWDFFTKMRERPELASVPVIVHSSASGRAPAGVTRALQKPVLFEQLISVVSEYCNASA
ncbi:MAG TPA: response regulator [Polyangiaceae bacterium]|jgi:CheY-like chemotaxis protein|nr:response regulator [Polyangiaceae bacterium]